MSYFARVREVALSLGMHIEEKKTSFRCWMDSPPGSTEAFGEFWYSLGKMKCKIEYRRTEEESTRYCVAQKNARAALSKVVHLVKHDKQGFLERKTFGAKWPKGVVYLLLLSKADHHVQVGRVEKGEFDEMARMSEAAITEQMDFGIYLDWLKERGIINE